MSFLKDPIVTNILTIISAALSVVSIIQGIQKNNSGDERSQAITIDIQDYLRQERFQPEQKVYLDSADAAIITVFLAVGGWICYPYRQEMALAFALFWWVVVVVQFRFSSKALLTPRGYNLATLLLAEVALDIIAILLLNKIPAELYLGLRFFEKLFPTLMAGLLSMAYVFLFFIGTLLIIFSLTGEESKLSVWSAKMLYKLWKKPAGFIFLTAILVALLMLLHIAGIE